MQKPLKNTFGLDINNSALTAVEFSYGKKGLKVVNFARVELNPGIVEDNCIIVDREAFKEALARLLREGYAGPINSRNVIFCIPEEKTFSHRLTIPRESAEDEPYIKLLARDFIPIELNEAAVDYKEISGDKKEVTLNFVAAQKFIIETIISVLSEAGLKTVHVDVDKNSLNRACDNNFQNSGCDYMIFNIGENITSFSIVGQSGISYTLDSEIAGNTFVDILKEGLKAGTLAEVKTMLQALGRDPEAQNKEEFKTIEGILKDPINKLKERISELSVAAESQDGIKVKKIYVIGSYSRTPGIINALTSIFPDSQIIPNFQYIQLNEDTELYYAKAIGLALKAIFPEDKGVEVNLLPRNEKEELFNRMLTPIVTKSLLAISIMITAITLFTGINMGMSYIGYKVSEREVEISAEKSNSPYLHQVAQESQLKTQLASQVTSILKDSMPISKLMSRMDNYNLDGIKFINLSYTINSQSNEMDIRAKTDSRETTEKLINGLKSDSYFNNIDSPLSNLSGKGERFINIGLEANLENILADSRPKPKKPSPSSAAVQTQPEDNAATAEKEVVSAEQSQAEAQTVQEEPALNGQPASDSQSSDNAVNPDQGVISDPAAKP